MTTHARAAAHRPAWRWAVWGQGSFFALLVLCVWLQPSYASSGGGFSNYGVHWSTVVPFTLAFGLAAASSFGAAEKVGDRRLARRLRLLGASFVLVALSTYPYKINAFWETAHHAAGIGFFLFELYFAGWLLRRWHDGWQWLLAAAQLGGFIMSALAILGVAHLLFWGQLAGAFAFGVLLVRTMTHD